MSYGVFSSVYDLLIQNVDYKNIKNVICSLLHENGVSEGLLLDNACGTGTLSILLSDAGFDVIGADKSPEMLMEAQRKSAEEGKNILFLNQSMTELDLYGTIKACVCTLDSINHLENISEVAKAFEKVSLFLEKSGIFIFDVNTLFKHREILKNNAFVYEADGVFCVWQNELASDTVNINLDFFIETENGDYLRRSEAFRETAYELPLLRKELENAGFSVLKILDGYSDKNVTETSQRAVFVCKKE